MVHRRGKKHLEAANKRMKEKEWELQKRQKEEQEDSLKTSSYEVILLSLKIYLVHIQYLRIGVNL
jgi:hypothetical protein